MSTPEPPTVERPASLAAPGENEAELLLDHLDAFRVLRATSDEEKSRLLEEIAGSGKPERDIVSELSKIRPLWRPDRFEEAHRLAVRSLEVLDRNGARPAQLPKLGPLTPIAKWAVQLVNRWIVRSHQNSLVDHMGKLYERREANAVWGSDEHHMLRRARINVEKIESGLKSKPLGLPTFLLGGAFLSGVFGALGQLVSRAFSNPWTAAAAIGVVVLLLLGLGWIVLKAAAVSRKRIRKCTDQPFKALWETIGAAGAPPKDQSYNFALYALLFVALAAVAIPLAALLVFNTT